jgi:hypothetical protein
MGDNGGRGRPCQIPTSAQERAAYLSWLIHLIGDLHVPLRCCSLVTDVYRAGDKAYLHGDLKGGTDKESAVDLPEGYTKAAKVVAEKEAALAGYRLADEIGKWVR